VGNSSSGSGDGESYAVLEIRALIALVEAGLKPHQRAVTERQQTSEQEGQLGRTQESMRGRTPSFRNWSLIFIRRMRKAWRTCARQAWIVKRSYETRFAIQRKPPARPSEDNPSKATSGIGLAVLGSSAGVGSGAGAAMGGASTAYAISTSSLSGVMATIGASCSSSGVSVGVTSAAGTRTCEVAASSVAFTLG
jgi:hypothetical protein